MTLAKENCAPCHSGTPPLSLEEARKLAKEIPEWTLKEDSIERQFEFKDFREAIGFVNKVAEVAGQEDHHPDIYIYYNKVRLKLSTHKIGGLSHNDFIVAAKIDKLV